jgi:hypothetical protein
MKLTEYYDDCVDIVLWSNQFTELSRFTIVRKYRKVIGLGESLFIGNDMGRFGKGRLRNCE